MARLATTAPTSRRVRPWALPAAAAAAIGAAVAVVFGRVPLSYDTYFTLIWGRDIVHGRKPQLELGIAPDPHPLYTAAAALLAPLGNGAEAGMTIVVLLSFGAACVALYRIAYVLGGGVVSGVIAALLLATRMRVLEVTVRASVDVPALALVLWAVALEVDRPRRRTGPLVLLSLAGLLRPEAWLFSGAYWLWITWGDAWSSRLRWLALPAIGPVVWTLHDWVLTGDPQWSRNHAVEKLGTAYKTGFAGIAEIPRHVGSIVGVSGAVAAAAGVVFVVWRLRERRGDHALLFVLAVLALNAVSQLILLVSDQPSVQRYFVLPSALLMALGAAAAGTLLARTDRRVVGIGLVVLIVASLPIEAVRDADLRTQMRADERLQHDLRSLVDSGPSRAAIEHCRPVYIYPGGIIPTLAFDLDVPPSAFRDPAPGGAFVATLPTTSAKDLPYPLGAAPVVPAGMSEKGRSSRWFVASGC